MPFGMAPRLGSAIRIRIAARPPRLMLAVQDNGRGFVAGGRTLGAGVGLRSLSERLEPRGGALKVESQRDTGTIVHIEIPLKVCNGRLV